ncbi:hypothetical protein ACFL1T_02710 [Chlamydiota bacterium]
MKRSKLSLNSFLNLLTIDTDINTLREYYKTLRNIGAKNRVRMSIELSDNVRITTESGIKQRHPEYTKNQIELAAIKLSIGNELFDKAYPDITIQP